MVLKKRCDAVFEGGGVRGIGLVGAVYQMERSGYTFGNVAGSSAGAIIASLLAAGYTGEEIYEEMKRVNYFKFKEKHLLDYFGIVGKLLSILFHTVQIILSSGLQNCYQEKEYTRLVI